ncbi:MAG: hypothetical protein WBP81_12260 [Solirubrobacteraceae bacterium]
MGATTRSGDAVDERGSDQRVELRVGRGVRGHDVRAVQQDRGICAQSAAIDPQLDVGIEHFQKRIEVATARRGQERIDDPSLSREVAVGLRRVAQPAAGSAGELLGCRFGSGRAWWRRRRMARRTRRAAQMRAQRE